MNKVKRYLENHKGATIQDYNNQKHRMHIIQASKVLGLNAGRKSTAQLITVIHRICN